MPSGYHTVRLLAQPYKVSLCITSSQSQDKLTQLNPQERLEGTILSEDKLLAQPITVSLCNLSILGHIYTAQPQEESLDGTIFFRDMLLAQQYKVSICITSSLNLKIHGHSSTHRIVWREPYSLETSYQLTHTRSVFSVLLPVAFTAQLTLL